MRSDRARLLTLAAALAAGSLASPEALARLGAILMGRGALEDVTVEVLRELPWLLRGLAFLTAIWIVIDPPHRRIPLGRGRRKFPTILAVAASGTLLALMVRIGILRSGLISGDEWNNEFTALLFAQGRLWDAPPPHAEFFRFTYFVTLPDRTFSIFPPLWPALLALGHITGIGASLNAVIGGVAALLVGLWNRAHTEAIASVTLLVLSPMLAFTAGSSFAGPTVLACLMGTLLCLRRALQSPDPTRWLAGGGTLWGLCFAAHYPTALGAGLPPLLVSAWLVTRATRSAGPALAGLTGAIVPLVVLGAYHHELHGGPPWLLPASLYEESMFAADLGPATIARGIAYTALHAVRLLGWTFPLLPVLALMRSGNSDPGDRLLVVSVVGLVLFYVIYPSAGGPQFGPRYWFGLLGPIAVLGGQSWARLIATGRGRAFAAVLLMSVVAVFTARSRIESVRAEQVNAPFRLAEEARITNAIVFMRNVNRADHARNPPGWSARVLFVPDLGTDRDGELLAHFPGRRSFTFRRSGSIAELIPGRPLANGPNPVNRDATGTGGAP